MLILIKTATSPDEHTIYIRIDNTGEIFVDFFMYEPSNRRYYTYRLEDFSEVKTFFDSDIIMI